MVETVDRYLISLYMPEEYNTDEPDNVLKRADDAFENVCAALEEAGVSNPKQLTTFEFHHRVDFYSKRNAKD